MYVQLQAALWEPLAFPGGGQEAFKNHLAQAGEQLRLRGLQMDPAVIPIFPTNAVCLRLHELAFSLCNFMRRLASTSRAQRFLGNPQKGWSR